MDKKVEKRNHLHVLRNAAAFGIGTALSCMSMAVEIDTGNDDLKIRFDNTVRYTIGVRAQDCDQNICGNGAGAGDFTAHQSDRQFAKSGDVVTNRIDVLSEFDLVYRKKLGFRVSGAAWYDQAYSDAKVKGDAFLETAYGPYAQGAGASGDSYANYTKRWNRGLSAEFLDAFAYYGGELDGMPYSIKVGQHNLYWGESLFSFVGGVSYNQGPVDIRKALANPGVEAKEIFKPLNQVSVTLQPAANISIEGQYLLDWKPSSLPDGGTYLGPLDGFGLGGTGTIFGAPTKISNLPDDKKGDWGLALKWRPEWLDGTAGFYYREYTNKFPQLTLTSFDGGFNPTGFGYDFRTGKREKLLGMSLAKQVGDISVGADLTYRPDAVLMATPFATYAPVGVDPSNWVPRGNITTGLVNMIAYVGKTSLFDSAVLTAEVNVAKLNSVTQNPQTFFGNAASCHAAGRKPTDVACPTKTAIGLAVLFEPKWYQVFTNTDLSMPIFLAQGVRGNSPVLFGDNLGQGSWSVGLTADIDARYNISLKYNGFIARHKEDNLGAFSASNSALGKFWDRDFISLTFKTTF